MFPAWSPYITLANYVGNGGNNSYIIRLLYISNGVASTMYRVKTKQIIALHTMVSEIPQSMTRTVWYHYMQNLKKLNL